MKILEWIGFLWMAPMTWFVGRFGTDDEGNLNLLGLVVWLPFCGLSIVVAGTVIASLIFLMVAVVFYLPLCVFMFENCP
ncbi:MAG: hypothetical protein U5L08_07915 [Xanthomonadales bacterium]|nr:hypothetical protein [Xanthomonadales bacterium]